MGQHHTHEALRERIDRLIPEVRWVFPLFSSAHFGGPQGQKIVSIPKDASIEVAMATLRENNLSAVPLRGKAEEISPDFGRSSGRCSADGPQDVLCTCHCD